MTNPKVDAFLQNAKKWQAELQQLRTIALECMLTEELKWKVPCYTHNQRNIVLIHGFKEYCAMAFFNGALLADSQKLLILQTENVQSGRQIRFANMQEIINLEPIIKAYIFEAIEVEKAGLKVAPKKHEDYEVPIELTQKMAADMAFKTLLKALHLGGSVAIYYTLQGRPIAKHDWPVLIIIPNEFWLAKV